MHLCSLPNLRLVDEASRHQRGNQDLFFSQMQDFALKGMAFANIYEAINFMLQSPLIFFNEGVWLRNRSRIFVRVGHETTCVSCVNNHIFSNSYHRQTYQLIMNNLAKDLKILGFKVIFQCLKLVESFQNL